MSDVYRYRVTVEVDVYDPEILEAIYRTGKHLVYLSRSLSREVFADCYVGSLSIDHGAVKVTVEEVKADG